VFLGERELANATAAAANDVASEAFANQAFYERGRVELAPGAALDLATAEVGDALGGAARYRNLAVEATVAGNRITVRAAAEVPRLFGGALPGTPRWVAVDARTTVRAVEQPGGICASDGGGC
jgi:hypothetical protein